MREKKLLQDRVQRGNCGYCHILRFCFRVVDQFVKHFSAIVRIHVVFIEKIDFAVVDGLREKIRVENLAFQHAVNEIQQLRVIHVQKQMHGGVF